MITNWEFKAEAGRKGRSFWFFIQLDDNTSMGFESPPYRMVNGIREYDPCGECGETEYLNEHGVCKSCVDPCTKCGKQPRSGTLIMCWECVTEEMKAGRG